MEVFNYNLDPEKIAERPVYPYDSAKLLVINKKEGFLNDQSFLTVADQLKETDLLIFNNTAVRPSRLFGTFQDTGGQVEVLLVKKQDGFWEALAKPLKKFTVKRKIVFPKDLEAQVVQQNEKSALLEFNQADSVVEEVALMPIPPYIRKGKADDKDKEDYQTFFAEVPGSIAAPTASLHFTPNSFQQLKSKGIEIDYLTLHVGTASFLPLWQDDPADLKAPGEEQLVVNKELKAKIIEAKKSNRRVIAVGTTAVRALESIDYKNPVDEEISTELFIKPGYQFKTIDGFFTNFHQPATTHLMLVQAFLGYDLITRAYQYAVDNDYRFLSYGDGMLCL